jgi:hypothetical protein
VTDLPPPRQRREPSPAARAVGYAVGAVVALSVVVLLVVAIWWVIVQLIVHA